MLCCSLCAHVVQFQALAFIDLYACADVTDPLIVTGNTPTTTVKAYLNDTYDYQHSFLGYVILIMIGTHHSLVLIVCCQR